MHDGVFGIHEPYVRRRCPNQVLPLMAHHLEERGKEEDREEVGHKVGVGFVHGMGRR